MSEVKQYSYAGDDGDNSTRAYVDLCNACFQFVAYDEYVAAINNMIEAAPPQEQDLGKMVAAIHEASGRWLKHQTKSHPEPSASPFPGPSHFSPASPPKVKKG